MLSRRFSDALGTSTGTTFWSWEDPDAYQVTTCNTGRGIGTGMDEFRRPRPVSPTQTSERNPALSYSSSRVADARDATSEPEPGDRSSIAFRIQSTEFKKVPTPSSTDIGISWPPRKPTHDGFHPAAVRSSRKASAAPNPSSASICP